MSNNIEQQFKQLVINKYNVYNNLFMNLPYEKMENIGMLLPILYHNCKVGFEQNKNPLNIIEEFFSTHIPNISEEEKISFLFKLIQYIERQVVLFDSIEDANFTAVNALSHHQSLEEIKQLSIAQHKSDLLIKKLEDFSIRIVLTAHPTQFYPSSVQGIIKDLRSAIKNNDINEIDILLQQLGKTSFVNKINPTPLEEAKSIIYYLRHVYYKSITQLYTKIKNDIVNDENFDNTELIELGFWPGGDRDGNPFVTAKVTADVAEELRETLMKCYYEHLKAIRNRLTFRTIDKILLKLSNQLYKSIFSAEYILTYEDILMPLLEAKAILETQHNNLFTEILEELITAVKIFKTHFATLDIRQDSSKHKLIIEAIIEKYNLSSKPFKKIGEKELLKILTQSSIKIHEDDFEDDLVIDTIKNVKQLKNIQQLNGEAATNRYIISNSETIFDMLTVYALFKFCGYENEEMNFDIIPLFETINGMDNAEYVMETLFNLPIYKKHLQHRNNTQTIMLGFSDGTKDGGYLKANWEIFETKERLSKLAKKYKIKIFFFDGRGGPPARGGGKTHRFYASQGKQIANEGIQLTIQGQTITSMYGTEEQFKFNCEQLISAGVYNHLFNDKTITKEQRKLMEELAIISFEKYVDLKNHPKFIPYLEEMSTLKYYGKSRISSRPNKRDASSELKFSDLRAIPFVGSWSQLKQNVPGYFGIGTALSSIKKEGKLKELKQLFKEMPFFKTLILNSMMSLSKSFFPLTAYMQNDKKYGEFWKILHEEYKLSEKMMLEISGYKVLMEEEPISKQSIAMREKIVLPLITIQQYALQQITKENEHQEAYETMVMRSLFGNINASRNSA